MEKQATKIVFRNLKTASIGYYKSFIFQKDYMLMLKVAIFKNIVTFDYRCCDDLKDRKYGFTLTCKERF